jgi:hypothetical protein
VQVSKAALQPVIEAFEPTVAAVGQGLQLAGGQVWEALSGVTTWKVASLGPKPLNVTCAHQPGTLVFLLCCPGASTIACPLASSAAAFCVAVATLTRAGLAPLAAILLQCWALISAAFLPLAQVCLRNFTACSL